MNTPQDQTMAGGRSQPSHDGTQQADHSAQHLKDEAARLAGQAKQQGKDQADHYRDVAAGKVESVADSIKAAASELDDDDMGQLSQQITRLADGMTKLSRGLREKSADEILRDVGNLSRKNPALFVAGGIAIGFGLTRLMKATASGSSDGESKSWTPSQGATQDFAADDTGGGKRAMGGTSAGSAAGSTPSYASGMGGGASGVGASGGLGAGDAGTTSPARGTSGTLGASLSGSSNQQDSIADWGTTDNDRTTSDESNGRKPQ